MLEGAPNHVLACEPDQFFETNDSPDPQPWVQVTLPPNVAVTGLTRYTWQAGVVCLGVITRVIDACGHRVARRPIHNATRGRQVSGALGRHASNPI